MRTRATLTGLAVAVVVVLASGVVAAIEGVRSDDGRRSGRTEVLNANQVAPSTTGLGAGAGAGVRTTIPQPTTTAVAPPATANAIPPPPPASATTTTRPGASTTTTRPRATTTTTLPANPPSVPSTVPPPGTWSNQSGGTSLNVRITPDEPQAGEAVTFVFEYSSDFPCCDLLVDWGDGTGFSDDVNVTCPEVPPRQPGSRRLQRTHTYREAGTYTLKVSAVAHSRCELVIPAFHTAQVSGAIVVS